METPSAGPSSTSEAAPSPGVPPERGDREVIEYLRHVILPALGDRVPRPIREAIRRSVRDQRLTPLEQLSGRHRHELLLAMERLSVARRRSNPAVLVRLTTVVSATAAASEIVGASAARPAR